MFRPRIIPVLLLKGRGLVKTKQFNKKKAVYIGDPINAVKIFNDMESDELVFLDITATPENRTVSVDLIKNIGDEAFMPFAVGGGIRSHNDIKNLIAAGAEKVVINTLFSQNPKEVLKAASIFGNQSIIISIDVKKNTFGKQRIFINCGGKQLKTNITEYARMAEEYGAGEILINSIDNDGMYSGYDIDMVKQIAENVSIPVIAVGGASNLDDFYKVTKHGNASAAAAGSLFVFHGPRKAVLINYPEKDKLTKLFTN